MGVIIADTGTNRAKAIIITGIIAMPGKNKYINISPVCHYDNTVSYDIKELSNGSNMVVRYGNCVNLKSALWDAMKLSREKNIPFKINGVEFETLVNHILLK